MPQGSESHECPFCREGVKVTTTRCSHCHADLVPTTLDHGGECPLCKEAIHVEAIRCKHCLANLYGAMIIHGSTATGIGRSVHVTFPITAPTLLY